MNPKIVIIGEAPSDELHYYDGYNTITQNPAGHITFQNATRETHIYVSKESYAVNFLDNEGMPDNYGKYIGTLKV